jgi:D-methionine transport system substrate-binding protein
LSQLGPGSRIVIPASAPGRALLVLHHYGLVGFDEQLGPAVTPADVKYNPRGLRLITATTDELEVELDHGSLVALQYHDAERRGFEPARHASAMEDAFSPFAQVLTVHSDAQRKQPPWLAQLLKLYRSTPVQDFILRRFEDSVRRAW